MDRRSFFAAAAASVVASVLPKGEARMVAAARERHNLPLLQVVNPNADIKDALIDRHWEIVCVDDIESPEHPWVNVARYKNASKDFVLGEPGTCVYELE